MYAKLKALTKPLHGIWSVFVFHSLPGALAFKLLITKHTERISIRAADRKELTAVDCDIAGALTAKQDMMNSYRTYWESR